MINADMPKLESLMRTLFPSAHMFSNTVWDDEEGYCIHYLDVKNKIECNVRDDGSVYITVTDPHTFEVKHEEGISGDWREVMNKIISIAEQVGVKSVFYQ